MHGLKVRPTTLLDRVYEHITLHPVITSIVDTVAFQRLRGLKQLGASSYLYPGAVHTRFEHSIGVSHLASVFMKKLREKQPDLNITEDDILRVSIAGLVHDLGHGPFSHLFEDVVASQLGVHFHHEEMTQRLVEKVFKDLRFSASDFEIVSSLAGGKSCPSLDREGKGWMKEVVANKRNGVDVDRLDYFARDALCCFGKQASDVRTLRLFNAARVVDEPASPATDSSDGSITTGSSGCSSLSTPLAQQRTIGYEKKMILSLRDLFALRARLFKHVYCHHTTITIGHMIGDVLASAIRQYDASSGDGGTHRFVTDADEFLNTGDWILDAIQATTEEKYAPARATLHRLKQRQLYERLLVKQLRHPRDKAAFSKEKIQQDICAELGIVHSPPTPATGGPGTSGQGPAPLLPFIVDIVRVDHGMKDQDPLSFVAFFDGKRANVLATTTSGSNAKKNSTSRSEESPSLTFDAAAEIGSPLFRPMQFQEETLMILARSSDLSEVSAVRNAVLRWSLRPDVTAQFSSGIN